MISACPICGNEYGVTHGDQPFVIELCDTCVADPDLVAWYQKNKREKEEKKQWYQTLRNASWN